jgi:hypothetical protein
VRVIRGSTRRRQASRDTRADGAMVPEVGRAVLPVAVTEVGDERGVDWSHSSRPGVGPALRIAVLSCRRWADGDTADGPVSRDVAAVVDGAAFHRIVEQV